MILLNLTTLLLGLGLATAIFFLIRLDHLRLGHGAFWLLVAAAAAVLGAWPGLIDRLAALIGISYPPALLLLAAVMVLFIKSLQSDIELTRAERRLRRLNQRLALYEAERGERAERDNITE